MMTTAYPDNWHFRIDFYGLKWESYRAQYPNRWPTRETVRRWVKECHETIQNTTRFCNERSNEL